MKALLMSAIRKLEVVDLPDPQITAPGEAIIELKAVGICGSDLHGYTGQTGRRKPPIVMGHEAAGVVAAVAPDVTNVTVGQRVAVHPLKYQNGKRLLIGMDEQGAYAERAVWPAANLLPLPDDLSYEAAAMTEPVAVTVRAVSKLPEPQGSLLVVGAGTIGLLAAQVARATGWQKVLVSDLDPTRLKVAEQLGFTPLDAAHARGEGGWRALVESHSSPNGVDAAIEAVGLGPTVAQAHEAVKYGGTVVWIGNNAKLIQIDMQDVVTRELNVHGTYGMNDHDFAAALRLLADGAIQLEPILSRYGTLDEGPALFEELLADPSAIKGMFVINP